MGLRFFTSICLKPIFSLPAFKPVFSFVFEIDRVLRNMSLQTSRDIPSFLMQKVLEKSRLEVPCGFFGAFVFITTCEQINVSCMPLLPVSQYSLDIFSIFNESSQCLFFEFLHVSFVLKFSHLSGRSSYCRPNSTN